MTYVEHDEERLFVLRKIKIKIKNSSNLKYLPSRLDESKICKENISFDERCEEIYKPCFWSEVGENGIDIDDDEDGAGHVQTPYWYQIHLK